MQLWIDTDTASDDAVALLMAFRWPNVDVLGVSVVAGNVPPQQGARNALYVAELCGVDVPVYLGAKKPLLRPYVHAAWFHGEDGLSDKGYAPAKLIPQTEHAVPALIAATRAHPGLTLVTLGPLTNIALAVQQAPDIAEKIGRVVIMGGAAATNGNVTPAAEYNIWVDPEAARMVFHSGLPITMVGWEFCQGEFVLSFDEIAQVRAIHTPYSDFTLDCNETAIEAYHVQTGEHGLSLPDAVAMAATLDPTVILRSSRHYVDVETQSELTRGMTVVDKLNVAHDERNRAVWQQLLGRGAPNVEVCWELDAARWKQALYRMLQAQVD